MYCQYGCGQDAKYQLKNGKWCCADTFNKCIGRRKYQKKGGSGVIGYKHETTPCTFCNKIIAKYKLDTHISTCKFNPINIAIRICKECGNTHNGLYASGTFCSPLCSHRFAVKNNKGKTKICKCIICGNDTEVTKHISNKYVKCLTCLQCITHLPTGEYVKKCKCGNNFNTANKHNKYCSEKCEYTFKVITLETRQKLSMIAKKAIKEGRRKRWNVDKMNKKPSYPEQFFIRVLDNNNIKYDREIRIDKYYIDFAITDKKIALEIDGKQHQQEERKLSDNKKDIVLKEHGWIIHRIPWKNINTIAGKIYIKQEIDKFLELYQSILSNVTERKVE